MDILKSIRRWLQADPALFTIPRPRPLPRPARYESRYLNGASKPPRAAPAAQSEARQLRDNIAPAAAPTATASRKRRKAPAAPAPRAKPTPAQAERERRLQAAMAWLRGELAAGPVKPRVLEPRAEAAGHAWRTVQRAASPKYLNVKYTTKGWQLRGRAVP